MNSYKVSIYHLNHKEREEFKDLNEEFAAYSNDEVVENEFAIGPLFKGAEYASNKSEIALERLIFRLKCVVCFILALICLFLIYCIIGMIYVLIRVIQSEYSPIKSFILWK